MDKNPLEITAASATVKHTTNKRGRPLNSGSIQFSNPQPRSALIAQILREQSLKKVQKSSEVATVHKVKLQARQKSSEGTSEQCWQSTSSVDNEYHSSEEDSKNTVEIKLEVVYETRPKRSKNEKPRKKSKKRLSNPQEKSYVCDYPNCSYAAKLSCNLVKHKRIHTSEKPYICDQCPFRTNFINSLKVHKRIHTAEKPFNCEICGYRCNTSSNLKKHRMHRHPEVAKI
ncbi:hypothetical protein NE865_05538 [Phthorimaea operculella]|nr:hypothetical protein NE865_05538 [Phthorimaea operculella]